MITVYGLKTCDTCRKALKWMMEESIPHRFHDLRKDGVPEAEVSGWLDLLGWETLINKRGTTWRGLSEDQREGLDDAGAKALILEHPALVKRPLFDLGDRVLLGFKQEQKDALRERAAAEA
ncbi:a glutathione-dependent thiol reductase [Caenispirillum salinarum AK4]|uniref:A glutathione-dependent thiol reductase n=1 Tax=Caenispirillum salinarum AK4 TaxID=1238182 RepID=K9GNL6_9PROT|nr:ArsC family reductase [Caenispirillum salinarum]EKV27555.1 a glutathione-dependent thiol reductase [Caenispirillum salinarum AK4]